MMKCAFPYLLIIRGSNILRDTSRSDTADHVIIVIGADMRSLVIKTSLALIVHLSRNGDAMRCRHCFPRLLLHFFWITL